MIQIKKCKIIQERGKKLHTLKLIITAVLNIS